MSQTPRVARSYCPGCEPDANPVGEVLDACWCDVHAPTRDGLDDAVVTLGAHLSGTAEAGGLDNKRWCDFFHREARPALAPSSPKPGRRRAPPGPAGAPS